MQIASNLILYLYAICLFVHRIALAKHIRTSLELDDFLEGFDITNCSNYCFSK